MFQIQNPPIVHIHMFPALKFHYWFGKEWGSLAFIFVKVAGKKGELMKVI